MKDFKKKRFIKVIVQLEVRKHFNWKGLIKPNKVRLKNIMDFADRGGCVTASYQQLSGSMAAIDGEETGTVLVVV